MFAASLSLRLGSKCSCRRQTAESMLWRAWLQQDQSCPDTARTGNEDFDSAAFILKTPSRRSL